jgi:hypothetical protein
MSDPYDPYADEQVVLDRLVQMCTSFLQLCRRLPGDHELRWKVCGSIRYSGAFKDLSRFDPAMDPQQLIEGLRQRARRDPGEDSRVAVASLLYELEHDPGRNNMNVADLVSLLYLAHGPTSGQVINTQSGPSSQQTLDGDAALPGAANGQGKLG